MSHSRQERLDNIDQLIQILMERTSPNWVKMSICETTDPALTKIFPTSWSDARGLGYVQQVSGFRSHYQLTGTGWVKGLELNGILNAPDFNTMLGKVCKSLKDLVKGREQAGRIDIEIIARQTEIAVGMISNIIEANLIETRLGRSGATWAKGFGGKWIVVPIDFGLEPL